MNRVQNTMAAREQAKKEKQDAHRHQLQKQKREFVSKEAFVQLGVQLRMVIIESLDGGPVAGRRFTYVCTCCVRMVPASLDQ